jgi:hypothetical protein
MSNLEIVFTLGIWALVAVVFCYYRSLAVKQQQNQEMNLHNARPQGNVGWEISGEKPTGGGNTAVRRSVDGNP